MEVIGRCFELNEEQQKQYAGREVKRMGIIIGFVFLGMVILLLALHVPMFIFGAVVPLLLVIFALVIGIRYAVVQKMATGYMLCFDDTSISSTFDKEKVGSVVTGMSKINEARFGSRMNQFIRWNDIDYISLTGRWMKVFSTKYDMVNGNGLIMIPAFIDDYEEVKNFFETKYKAKINRY